MRKAKAQPENTVDTILRAGQLVDGKYRVERLLGEGGMAAVWAGTNERTGKRVALKVILRSLAKTSEARDLFHSEVQAASRVNHPNVVTVFDVIEHEGMPCIVMELLDGEPLGSYIAFRGFLTVGEATAVLLPAMRGVAAAHAQGVIHRDLKPQNIFICIGPDGRVVTTKVLDFGISVTVERAMDPSAGPAPSLAMGTPAYMSPEHLVGSARIDERSDVYGFGVLLYEALTGQMPFPGQPGPELFHRILNEPAPPLAQVRPDLPPGLVSIIDKAMAKKPGDRYSNLNLLLGSIEDELAPATPGPRMLTPNSGVPESILRERSSEKSAVQAVIQQEPSGQSQETQIFGAPLADNQNPAVLAGEVEFALPAPASGNSNPVVQAVAQQEPSGQFPDTQLFIAPLVENQNPAVLAGELEFASPAPVSGNSTSVVQAVVEQEPSGQFSETQLFIARPTEKDIPVVAMDGQADDGFDDGLQAEALAPPMEPEVRPSPRDASTITVPLSGLRALSLLHDWRWLVGAGCAITLGLAVWMAVRSTRGDRQAAPARIANPAPTVSKPSLPPAISEPAAANPAVAIPSVAPTLASPAVAVPAPAATNPAVADPAPLAVSPFPAEPSVPATTEHREATRPMRDVPVLATPRRSPAKNTAPLGRHAAHRAWDGHAPALNPSPAATAGSSTRTAAPAPTASPSSKSAVPRAGSLSADDF